MPIFRPSWWSSPPVILRYAVAVAAVSLATVLGIVFDRFSYPAPYVSVFVCAVMLSAWFGGLRPGLLAVALSALAFDYFFFDPRYSLALTLNDAPRFIFFVLSTFLVALLCVIQRNSAQALRRARDELAAKVRELCKINEASEKENIERKRAEALLEGQRRVLEMVATDAPLPESLTTLVLLIEAHAPGMLGSILLLDPRGNHLHHGAAPNLPAEYVRAIDGTVIGPEVGSCGAAAYCKEAVLTEDIATDPRWKGHKDAALPHGLRACWSTPIFDAHQRVLGTFAMYYRQPGLPKPEHLRLIEMATHMASVAISRNLSESALRESEAKLKAAQRLANIGYWERDLIAGRITWSEQTCRIWGQPSEGCTLNQAELEKMIHPDDRQIQKQALADAIAKSRPYDVEYRILRSDGEIRFLHVRDDIEYDPAGRPIRIFGTVQDITARKQAEVLLHSQEQEIRAVVENSPDPIARYDRELYRTYVNPAFIKANGVPEEALLGKKFGSAVRERAVPASSEEVEILQRAIESAFDTSRPVNVEITWPQPAGRRNYAVHLEPEFDEHGALTSVLSIARDVTDRKRAEETVRDSQQLLQLVLATLPVGVMVIDQAGDTVLVNTAAKHIWGDVIVAGPERWAQSKGFWHDSGERIAQEDWASFRALTKGQTSLNEVIDIETFDGRQKIISNSAAPIRNTGGRLVGAVIVNEDVTDLKKNEEKLHQTEADLARMSKLTTMGELTASIAHEVNQPLTAVVTNADAALRWLVAEPPNLGEAREAVQRIARDGKRASEVIKRIRAFMKKGEPVRTRLKLNDLIRETVALAQPEITRKRVSLQTELAPDLPRVPADRVQLQQVLLNLVVNSLDSMGSVADRRRVLHISTDLADPHAVHVAIRDNGVGIGPQEATHLYDPFFTTKPDGLGMGLAICRSILEAHGGRLWATPNDGPGITFQFTLPVQEGGSS